MDQQQVVRRFEVADTAAAVGIIRGLPDYFTSDVPAKIESDANAHDSWVLLESGDVIGIAVVEKKSAGAVEILWMAIDAAHRGRGKGTVLLAHVMDFLASTGISVVEVKTLDPSSDYQPYVATRAFWEGNGFVHIDSIDPLPGWQPGNPAGIYVAAFGPTR